MRIGARLCGGVALGRELKSHFAYVFAQQYGIRVSFVVSGAGVCKLFFPMGLAILIGL